MISILLVEDHTTFAAVLARLLRTTGDMEVVAIAHSAERTLQELPDQKFDLALVDVALPQMNGISLISILRNEYPNLPCLMLSGHSLSHYVTRALEAGARGYILKDDGAVIIEGIRRVLRGEIYISKELR